MKRRSSFALGFLALIGLGAVLLSAPFARAAGTWGDFSNALFTACSAVCVTGLTVVEVATEYTPAGLAILVTLVEIGGVGLMTLGTFLLVAIGRRLSLSSEFSLMNAYGAPAVKGLKGLIFWVVGSMAAFQLLGAAALYWRFGDVKMSLFYSTMNFCNAGFSLHPGSLSHFAGDPWALGVMTFLTVAGGIGFLVIYNLCTYRFLRRGSGVRGRLTLHSVTVLRFSAYLVLVMLAAFLLIEWNAGLRDFSPVQKLSVGLYQSVTPRTCGFCIVPTESLHPLTRLIYEVMMFIGGGPGSVSGGIKVTTFAVLVYTLTAMCRGETETVITRRTVPMEIVRESIVILVALLAFVALVTGALFVTEERSGIPLDALFFEAVSAVTTTGLSMGDTTVSLSRGGRVVIMLAMFIGRLGALTVVMMIGDRESTRRIRYPSEELVVG